MLGLFENLAWKLDNVKVSVEGALAQPICDVKNHIVDKQYEKKHKQYQKAIEEAKAKGEWQGVDEDAEENVLMNEDVALYMELLQRVARHEDISVRNPVDIAIELGYSEQDVKTAFEYMQQMMKDEEAEHSVEVCCPKCGETRITTPNTGITCKGCGVRLVVGEEGEVQRVI